MAKALTGQFKHREIKHKRRMIIENKAKTY